MPPVISIKLLRDSKGNYAIDVHPTTLRVSPRDNPNGNDEDERVTMTFALDPDFPQPHSAKAVLRFNQTPFNEENGVNHTAYVGAPAQFAFLRETSVGTAEDDVELYKYSITVTTPEGTDLNPLDPSVMVRRRSVGKSYYTV